MPEDSVAFVQLPQISASPGRLDGAAAPFVVGYLLATQIQARPIPMTRRVRAAAADRRVAKFGQLENDFQARDGAKGLVAWAWIGPSGGPQPARC